MDLNYKKIEELLRSNDKETRKIGQRIYEKYFINTDTDPVNLYEAYLYSLLVGENFYKDNLNMRKVIYVRDTSRVSNILSKNI